MISLQLVRRVADDGAYYSVAHERDFGDWIHHVDHVDYGEVHTPGFLRWLLRRPAKIIRDADIAAAMESLAPGAAVQKVDPSGSWIVYQIPGQAPRIRFRARDAWFPNEPTIVPNGSERTNATIDQYGRVVVTEGLHRTRAMARRRVVIAPKYGGVEKAPGWLDFSHDPTALSDTPSSREILKLLGDDPEAPLIPAR